MLDRQTMAGRSAARFALTLALITILGLNTISTIHLLLPLNSLVPRAFGAPAPDSWPTFHHDAMRSGFASGPAPHYPRILWNFTTGGGILTSPVVGDGTVFVASHDGSVYALNESTGKLLWRQQLGNVVISSPALYGGGLYVAAGHQTYRLNASNGARMWNQSAGSVLPLLATSGRVYTYDDTGISTGMYSLNAVNGSLLWYLREDISQGFAYHNGLLYGGTRTSQIIALNATTGALVWSYKTDAGVEGGFTVANGILYGGSSIFPSFYGNFTALNATNGNLMWKRSLPANGPPAVAYGRLFLSWGGGTNALNRTNGAVLWSFSSRFGGYSGSMPAVADGLVFVGGGGSGSPVPDPTIYAVNATTGQLVWSLPVKGCADSSPAIANGTVYVGDGCLDDPKGTLYAIVNAVPPRPSNPLILIVTVSGIFVSGFVISAWLWTKRKTGVPRLPSRFALS